MLRARVGQPRRHRPARTGHRKRVWVTLTLACVLAAIVATAEGTWLSGHRHLVAQAFFRAGSGADHPERAERLLQWALRADGDHLATRDALVRRYQHEGRFREADAVLEPWLDQPDDAMTASSHHDGWLLYRAGVNRFAAGQAVAARVFHERALAHARRAEDFSLEAAARIGRARVYYHLLGEIESARADLDHALRLARSIRDPRLEADALRNQGVLAWWFEGAANKALDQYYRPALALYRGAGDDRGAAITSSNIGLAHASLGDPARALAAHQEALQTQRDLGDQSGQIDTSRNLAALYAAIGDRSVARRLLRQNLARARTLGYGLAANEIEAVLAEHHATLGAFDQALALLERVAARERDAPLLAAHRLGGMAELSRLAGRPGDAARYLERASAIQPPEGTVETRAAVAGLLGRAEIRRDLGDWAGADALLETARARLAGGTEAGRWHWDTLLVSAEVAAHRGRTEAALAMLEKAAHDEAAWLAAAPSRQSPMVRAFRYDRLYRLLLASDSPLRTDTGHATRADALAFRFLEHVRHRAFRSQGTRSPERGRPTPESEAMLARLEARVRERVRDTRDTADASHRWQAVRASYDAYQAAVVREELLAEPATSAAVEPPRSLASIQNSLDPNTALLAYAFAGEQAYALVLENDALERFALPTNRASLRAKVRLLGALLEAGVTTRSDAPRSGDPSGDPTQTDTSQVDTSQVDTNPTDEAWAPIAAGLWRDLIAPITARGTLDGVERLGILPADALTALPFAVLFDGTQARRRFLAEDVALFFPPSANALVGEPKPRRNEDEGSPMLAVAMGRAIERLPALPFARDEAQAAVAAIGGEVLIDGAATESVFKARAPSFRTLHVASHAVPLPELPLLSAIKLAPSETDDGNLTVAEIMTLGLEADLVTLASCQGAASWAPGADRPDERRRISLVDAFLRAGSRAVVASLAPVDDRSAHAFMAAFYRHLGNRDPVAALAAAQRELLAGPEAHRHPRHWAPFVLVGHALSADLSVGTQ